MNIIPFQAIYPNQSLIASTDIFFNNVKNQFQEFQNSGFFNKSSQEAIYVYELTSTEGRHRGIMSSTDIEDFINGKVLKHENTIAAKEQQMMNIMLQNKTMVKPVLLAYDPVVEIDAFIDRIIATEEKFFEVNFVTNSEKHSIWEVSQWDKIAELASYFKKHVTKSYIADGHHRVATSLLLNRSRLANTDNKEGLSGIFTIYFSWPELTIYDYNRCIDAFQKSSPLRFMAKLSKVCKIKHLKEGSKPTAKFEMTMNLYNEWYRLKWKKSIIEKHKEEVVIFDAFLLNKYVFEALLNVKDVREDARIAYIDGVVGVKGMEAFVSNNQNRVGFCLYPVPYEDVKKIADVNGTLPPKSTWFEPRVKNGLLAMPF